MEPCCRHWKVAGALESGQVGGVWRKLGLHAVSCLRHNSPWSSESLGSARDIHTEAVGGHTSRTSVGQEFFWRSETTFFAYLVQFVWPILFHCVVQLFPHSNKHLWKCFRSELLWYYQDGASHVYPDVWDDYLEPIPQVGVPDRHPRKQRIVTVWEETCCFTSSFWCVLNCSFSGRKTQFDECVLQEIDRRWRKTEDPLRSEMEQVRFCLSVLVIILTTVCMSSPLCSISATCQVGDGNIQTVPWSRNVEESGLWCVGFAVCQDRMVFFSELVSLTLLSNLCMSTGNWFNLEFRIYFVKLNIFFSFSHYFVHGGFFPSDDYLLSNVDKIRHIPATIVQGRYDMVCPATTAWELHKVRAYLLVSHTLSWGSSLNCPALVTFLFPPLLQKWPEADFHLVQDAGHSAKEPGITSLLVEACNKYKLL